MHIFDVLEEIKGKLRLKKLVWTGHAKDRFQEKLAPNGITRQQLLDAIVENGECIRFEWQYGYSPRVLVYIQTTGVDDDGEPKILSVHVALVNEDPVVITTVYDDLTAFKSDGKTRIKRNSF
jgi:hypothetical protein